MMQKGDYDWKDSNLALFGSDEDKGVKKESAETEPAWKPVRAIDSTTTLVWRINNFKVEPWPTEDYGSFFSGDSYIVLHVEKNDGALTYDAHFWIGRESTQDEYGTAAYKTVELDTFLDDKAIQHREVDGYESKKFKSYFTTLQKLKGGCDSGFRRVVPGGYRPRLLLCHGLDSRHIEVTEVTLSRQSLNSDDVFILDNGQEAFQWNGKGSSKDERFKAAQFMQQLSSSRHGKYKTSVLDEDDNTDHSEFLNRLPDVAVAERKVELPSSKAIYRLSDASGSMDVSLVCEGNLPRSAITNDDVYFIDSGEMLFVYVGSGCSRAEKLNALSYAHNYLQTTQHPFLPVAVVTERVKSKELEDVLE